MKPHMTDAEIELFVSSIAKAHRYLEWGVGGSTILAIDYLLHDRNNWIISIDSDKEWIKKVRDEAYNPQYDYYPINPMYIDIGPVGNWSYPSNPDTKHLWPNYHSLIWEKFAEAKDADFVFIDGRFRVACFAQTVLHCNKDVKIALHDTDRLAYADVYRLGVPIERVDNLALFSPRLDVKKQAEKILDNHRLDSR